MEPKSTKGLIISHIAISSATTSTLVVEADRAPQYIEGISRGSCRHHQRGCLLWQMKRLIVHRLNLTIEDPGYLGSVLKGLSIRV